MAFVNSKLIDGWCILRLDAPPLNTLTFDVLDALHSALNRANADPDVHTILLMGGTDHFSAGADINLFERMKSPDEAVGLSQRFQDVFQHVEDSAKPVAVLLAGHVMGGALELGMACHIRIAVAGTRFSMPEVTLGISPGAGGTQRLPRLVGIDAAMDMMLTGRPIDADSAKDLGLIHAVCSAEAWQDQARQIVDGTALCRTGARDDKLGDQEQRRQSLDWTLKRVASIRPEIVASREILAAVRIGLEVSFAAGIEREREAFATCMQSPAARHRIYLFFASRGVAKIPELADVEPASVERVAVVGMGTMGTGIAHALLRADVPVTVLDEDGTALRLGRERIRRSFQKRVERGQITEHDADRTLDRLTFSTHWADLSQADLVIESVYEDAQVKRSVLEHLDRICGGETLLATNTSTISLDDLASGLKQSDRLIGMHFFNPAQRMPLVEIVRRESTPASALATALALAKRIRKTPVLVANREGFLVNRIFVPYLQEAFWLLEEGAEARAIDRAAMEFGFPMGPLALIDMAGLDILVDAQRVLARAFPRHGPLSAIVTDLVERRQHGQKSQAGVYRYEARDHTPRDNQVTEQVVQGVRRRARREARHVDDAEIVQRLVLRMVNEAYYVLEENVARSDADVDVAIVLGTGFPDFRGGPLRYAADLGLDQVLAKLEDLTERHGERFRPARQLRDQEGVI